MVVHQKKALAMSVKLFSTLLLLLSVTHYNVAAQPDSSLYKSKYYCPAMFKGGDDSMRTFIAHNLQYPEIARENNIEGRVIIKCNLNEHGVISNPVVKRSLERRCDSAALEVVRKMPLWIPATYKATPIRSEQIIVIVYRLE
jgi:TonB family protein